jgi:hypothetical protein
MLISCLTGIFRAAYFETTAFAAAYVEMAVKSIDIIST